jgi:hypothetical protein
MAQTSAVPHGDGANALVDSTPATVNTDRAKAPAVETTKHVAVTARQAKIALTP